MIPVETQGHCPDSLHHNSFQQLVNHSLCHRRADAQGGMGPGRLCKIFDSRSKAARTVHKQNIAFTERCRQLVRRTGSTACCRDTIPRQITGKRISCSLRGYAIDSLISHLATPGIQVATIQGEHQPGRAPDCLLAPPLSHCASSRFHFQTTYHRTAARLISEGTCVTVDR